ncbi:hypothetical protein AB0I61_17240 [Polymorphospora rubra]|uniref:zinc finger domain-containing protein n=1 Tax=Polymorphospora rubra TaxID=338584 RepID=UPI0033EC427E
MTTYTRRPADLAADLRHIANLIANLPDLSEGIDVAVHIGPSVSMASNTATIDALANHLGITPAWDNNGGDYGMYGAKLAPGGATWSVRVGGYLRRPASREQMLEAQVEQLQAEVEQLRAQTPATAVDEGPEHPCPRCHAQPGEDCEPDCDSSEATNASAGHLDYCGEHCGFCNLFPASRD